MKFTLFATVAIACVLGLALADFGYGGGYGGGQVSYVPVFPGAGGAGGAGGLGSGGILGFVGLLFILTFLFGTNNSATSGSQPNLIFLNNTK